MRNDMKKHTLEYIQKGIRTDGRRLKEFRPVSVEYNVSETAEGSARVKIGKTEVIVGVKLSIEKPYPDTPDQGCLMVGAELLPLSNPDFDPGPPRIEAIELARVVDRGIRESKCIDTKQLCITPGEKAWTVCIDICTINVDGNLFDAAALAAFAALKDTRFPTVNDNGSIDYREKTDKKLPLLKDPISVTVMSLGNYLFVDPTPEEESIIDSRLTVAATADQTLCALQKGGDDVLNLEQVEQMVALALEKSAEIRKLL